MSAAILGLFGGGLDSLLAVRLLQAQGAGLACVHFDTGFVNAEREARVRRLAGGGPEGDFPLRVESVIDDYLRDVVVPHAGETFGESVRIASRIFMLKRAGRIAGELGIDLIFTGEVLGQSVGDQGREGLELTESRAGVGGRVLRPLSALHLAPTAAEEQGRVDRRRLSAIQGRSRRGQIELAARLGLHDPPTPSGDWSRLADPRFARRLRDLLSHRQGDRPEAAEIRLLALGRHFRLSWGLKLIVARDAEESARLEAAAGGQWICRVAGGRGAVGLVAGRPGPEAFETIGAICARYSALREQSRVEVVLRRDGEERRLEVAPIDPGLPATLRV